MDRELLLLGLLRQQEMHGYQLYDFIERDLSYCTDMKKPTAYYLLNKMSESGWISEEQSQDGNRPPRKVYALTSQGEESYMRLLRENLAQHTPPNFSDDIGLAFLDSLELVEAIALLQTRRDAVTAALREIQDAPSHHGSLQLVIEHQVRFLSAELDWLDELITQLTERAVPQ